MEDSCSLSLEQALRNKVEARTRERTWTQRDSGGKRRDIGKAFVERVLLQSWGESSEDSVSHSLMAAACGRC